MYTTGVKSTADWAGMICSLDGYNMFAIVFVLCQPWFRDSWKIFYLVLVPLVGKENDLSFFHSDHCFDHLLYYLCLMCGFCGDMC